MLIALDSMQCYRIACPTTAVISLVLAITLLASASHLLLVAHVFLVIAHDQLMTAF